MNGWILLVVGLVSLAIIAGAFIHLGLRAWRLARRGIRLARSAGPTVADITRRADALTALADELARNGDEIAHNLERLRRSAERLQILLDAWDEALRPYRRTREFFGL